MQKRREKIIEHLIYSEKGVTGVMLSNRLSVSARTIRNDISAINAQFQKAGAFIKADKANGYYISKKDKQIFLEELSRSNTNDSGALPATPSERLVFIALKLIWETDYISMEALAGKLYVSKTTISNDIKRLSELAMDCKNLKIGIVVSSIKGLLLEGAESQKRFFLFQLIDRFFSHNLHAFKKMLKLIHFNFDNDFFTICNSYVLYLDTHNIALSDNDLNILVIETAISLYRILDCFAIEKEYKSISEEGLDSICDEISKSKNVELSPEEILFFNDCLALKRVLIIDGNVSVVIREDAKYIVEAFIEEIHRQYQINLLITDSFVKNLSIHISSMMNRIKVGSYDDFSIANEIKMTYPFAFELATNIIPIIKAVAGAIINETELSYIAVYLAVVLEKMKNKKNVAIICGSGLGTAQLIINRLETFFYNEINVVGYYSVYQMNKILSEQENEIDMLLSTIPVSIDTTVPVVRISPLFTQEDINKLKGMLHHNKSTIKTKKENMFSTYSVFDKNLFKQYKKEVSHIGILNDLTDLLVHSGYVDYKDEFLSSVWQREALYSTIYGNIWLPHPMESMSNDTVAAIAVVNSGRLQLIVFLLAINSKQYDKFHFLYEKIINLINSKAKIKNGLLSTCLEELISIMDNPE